MWMKALWEKLYVGWLYVMIMDKYSHLWVSHWHWKISSIFSPQTLICTSLSCTSRLGAILSFLASLSSSLALIFYLIVAMPFLADISTHNQSTRVSLPISSPSNYYPEIQDFIPSEWSWESKSQEEEREMWNILRALNERKVSGL